jgi:hypothetical protein
MSSLSALEKSAKKEVSPSRSLALSCARRRGPEAYASLPSFFDLPA